MPQYAQFDPIAVQPAPVLGWYDTDALHYPTLPAANALLQLTADQWAHRMDQPWGVQNSTLVPYTPPVVPPTLVQQAQALLAGPVTVSCTSNRALNGNYPCDSHSLQQMTTITMAQNANLGLPGGGSTFNWPDTSNTSHAWAASQFTAFAQAMMNFVYAAQQVVQGHSTTLPSSHFTIP
jgi:hypothetical protein